MQEVIEPYIITREDVQWKLFRYEGDDTHDSLGYMETVDVVPEFGQRLRLGILDIHLSFHGNDLRGRCSGISVKWGQATLSVSGVIPPDTKYTSFTITTKFKDVKHFSRYLGKAILTASMNGVWRDHFGHNHTKPYNDAGQEIENTYSDHRKTIPGTFDYQSYNDGDALPEVLIEPVG